VATLGRNSRSVRLRPMPSTIGRRVLVAAQLVALVAVGGIAVTADGPGTASGPGSDQAIEPIPAPSGSPVTGPIVVPTGPPATRLTQFRAPLLSGFVPDLDPGLATRGPRPTLTDPDPLPVRQSRGDDEPNRRRARLAARSPESRRRPRLRRRDQRHAGAESRSAPERPGPRCPDRRLQDGPCRRPAPADHPGRARHAAPGSGR
jgi:hypothetical protein